MACIHYTLPITAPFTLNQTIRPDGFDDKKLCWWYVYKSGFFAYL